MRIRRLEIVGIGCLLCGLASAQERPGMVNPRGHKSATEAATLAAVESIGSAARFAPGPMEPIPDGFAKLTSRAARGADDAGGVRSIAGAVAGESGTIVYSNTTADPSIYRPGPAQRLADDIELATVAGCPMSRYTVVVFGNAQTPGAATFNVHTELWNGDPCLPGSSVIANTGRDFLNIANDQSAIELNAFFDQAPINIPQKVYLAVTFPAGAGASDAGWVIAGKSERGFNGNFWSEQDVNQGCDQFFFGCETYAGFFAEIACALPAPPNGACCNGTTCTQTTEANCVAGNWKGPFTTCNPNACLGGACCAGDGLATCTDSSKAECTEGLFLPGVQCASSPCADTYIDFLNDFDVLGFHRAQAGALRADDVRRAGAGPCELAGYSIVAIGNGVLGPPKFNASVDLAFNAAGIDPDNELDDVPAFVIPGTHADFTNVPADFCPQNLIVNVGPGIMLPSKFWVVFAATSSVAGPYLAGPAKFGRSLDAFSQFNTDAAPNQWQPGFWFGGFNQDGCPAPDCVGGANVGQPCADAADCPGGICPGCTPAGSFRITVYCRGDRPTGVCCDDRLGTCADGVIEPECAGRWRQGETCAENTLDPPCGAAACCSPILGSLACRDLLKVDCDAAGGEFAKGKFCDQMDPPCPSLGCFNATGPCFTAHNGKGCSDGFCCEKVCAEDDFCCGNNFQPNQGGNWDAECALRAVRLCQAPANDVFGGARPLTGPGPFDFDNTLATGQGPDPENCSAIEDIDGIADDLWFCWTSPCGSFVNVDTCNPPGTPAVDQTMVDTKVAVYRGCSTAPSDANLVDCDDDACGFQSQMRFVATAGESYLIRVGSFPATMDGGMDFPVRPRGRGKLSVSCITQHHAACDTGTGSCCTDTNEPGCDDVSCCDLVCACDSYCCNVEWDELCAAFGAEGSGCGALAVCGNLCGSTCPIATVSGGGVTFVDPPHGVVDARQPMDPISGTPRGIKTLVVEAPSGAQSSCFQLCETASAGGANGILSVMEAPIGGGMSNYTIMLTREITPLATTTITYRDDANSTFVGRFISHPGNVNADAVAGTDDIQSLIARLNGITPDLNAPWGAYSSDVDFSGATTSADLAAAVDALNGAGLLNPTNGTSRPPQTCP